MRGQPHAGLRGHVLRQGERFALLDAALLRRVAAGPEPAPEVVWTFRRLAAAEGRLAVGPLADEVGWSRRHLAARWRRDVGMGPKAVEFRALAGSTPREVTFVQDPVELAG